ncbi:uncharacterized protein LOC132725120 [Ruditapes philippinarum]|uniref:uncharacterized protein LOC132725120 n=1 Tax=Ruditapes philippinarum TaxID=129788 RepID=UPI00295B1683|nr:uncharacterized protein LOC132725120 [Ruditapes philippinarum]
MEFLEPTLQQDKHKLSITKGDDQLAKRRKKSGRTSSYANVQKYLIENEQTVLPQQMTTPFPYLPPHKMESSFQSPGIYNDTDTNSTTYFSDSTETSNLSSPLTNFAQDIIKTKKSEDK